MRILLFILLSTSIYSQRLIDRFIIYNPLRVNENSGMVEGWGGFSGYLSADDEHAWNQRLGLSYDFFGDQSLKFSLTGSIEFIANPHNDIKFNPRAVFWDEGLILSIKHHSSGVIQAGYMHRCKHDIDNLNLNEERGLIYGSIMTRYIYNVNAQNSLALKLDLYTIKQDYRLPEGANLFKPNIEYLFSSLLFNYSSLYPLTQQTNSNSISLYSSGYLQWNIYKVKKPFFSLEPDYSNLSAGISAGVVFRSSFRIGFTYEYLPDTGINSIPRKADLLSFGVSLQSISFY